jgi:hypothetical protein
MDCQGGFLDALQTAIIFLNCVAYTGRLACPGFTAQLRYNSYSWASPVAPSHCSFDSRPPEGLTEIPLANACPETELDDREGRYRRDTAPLGKISECRYPPGSLAPNRWPASADGT